MVCDSDIYSSLISDEGEDGKKHFQFMTVKLSKNQYLDMTLNEEKDLIVEFYMHD